MARASDEIELAWRSLRSEEQTNGWRTITITPARNCQIAAGRHFPEKLEALLVGFSGATIPVSEKLPDGVGFNVERVDQHGDGRTWLALTRKSTGDIDLFLTMVCDVAGSLDEETALKGVHPIRRFLARVRGWQEFMRKGAQALSAEVEIGLVGELSFFEVLVASGISVTTCMESWLGPFDAPQDFVLGMGAIEVKATLAAVGFPAKIGSLEQLDDAVLQPLFVAGIRLRLAENGRSLPSMVSALRRVIEGDADTLRMLSERLVAVGYFDQHADRYNRRFTLYEMKIVPVRTGFPRLTLGSVPVGITRASYDIDLDKVTSSAVSLPSALQQLGVL